MILIEITIPGCYVTQVEPTLIQCCIETGDEFLGREYFQEIDEWLFVVHLLEDFNLSKHVPILSQALEQKAIASFEFVQGNLVHLSSQDILEQMHSFPLSLGDSWIPALNDVQSVFLCCHRRVLTPKQISWLVEHHEIRWHYV